jgi:hypothetical protein
MVPYPIIRSGRVVSYILSGGSKSGGGGVDDEWLRRGSLGGLARLISI